MSGPEVDWSALKHEDERPDSPPRTWRRRVAAAVIGVAASVASAVATTAVLGSGPIGRSVLVGLVIGSLVAGMILRAHGWRAWLGAAVLVVLAQFALGLILTVLSMTRA